MNNAADSKPTINSRKLDELRAFPARADRPSLLVRVIGLFHEESRELLTRLHRAIDSGDAEDTREAAHKFKSVAGNVGAEALSALCQQLELLSLERRLEEAGVVLERLREEHRRASESLAAEVPGTAAP